MVFPISSFYSSKAKFGLLGAKCLSDKSLNYTHNFHNFLFENDMFAVRYTYRA